MPDNVVHVLWLHAGLSCDGESVAMTAATSPSIEEVLEGAFPGAPRVVLHCPMLSPLTGDEFMQAFHDAEAGRLAPFVLFVEGSIPNEDLAGEGHWTGFGVNPANGQPITVNDWVDRLAPRASAIVAIGTCAAFGGIPAMKNNPTGAMGLRDYLGPRWQTHSKLPIVSVPGCPTQPDSITQIMLATVTWVAGGGPKPELDDLGRPVSLFERTTREGCNRAGFTEQGQFAKRFGDDPRCLVKLGCKGPVSRCNVPVRGWVNGVGGCPNVGGICIGCTMPAFPDRFMPFMEADPWGNTAANFQRFTYGPFFRFFRKRSVATRFDREPEWRTYRW